MKTHHLLALFALFSLGGCNSPGAAGEECNEDADCAEGLECHAEEGEDVGHCEEHDEHEGHDHD